MSTLKPANSDYSLYSKDDLILRVRKLESRLVALSAKHAASNHSSPAPPKKKPKKAGKPFEPSKYHTRLIALKFAYLGGKYCGLEYHANNVAPLPTVEEELWKALRTTKLIFPTFREGQGEDEVCWDGCEYSKCGRTDRGVSAFGQVIAIRVRSSRPKTDPHESHGVNGAQIDSEGQDHEDDALAQSAPREWHHIQDEVPYVQLLNRVLPPDIRILAWCPDPPPNFSARFHCRERRYRYFFSNPAYLGNASTAHDATAEGWLNIDAMRQAAKMLEGLHDFRNLCKVDPSKQITNFERRIFHADIYAVNSPATDRVNSNEDREGASRPSQPQIYYFEVRGSAFLWHQVRHMVAILFLVGQGYEDPSIVEKLLDVRGLPEKPMYDMASDIPLVLWDCIFPELEQSAQGDHSQWSADGYTDSLKWVFVGDDAGRRTTSEASISRSPDDGKYGRNGIMDDLWYLWRKRKMEEVLTGNLMDIVANSGASRSNYQAEAESAAERKAKPSDRVFDGSERPRTVGTYVPILQRARMEAPNAVNERYATRKSALGSTDDSLGGDDGCE